MLGHLDLDFENPQPNPEPPKGLKQFVWLGSNVAVLYTSHILTIQMYSLNAL